MEKKLLKVNVENLFEFYWYAGVEFPLNFKNHNPKFDFEKFMDSLVLIKTKDDLRIWTEKVIKQALTTIEKPNWIVNLHDVDWAHVTPKEVAHIFAAAGVIPKSELVILLTAYNIIFDAKKILREHKGILPGNCVHRLIKSLPILKKNKVKFDQARLEEVATKNHKSLSFKTQRDSLAQLVHFVDVDTLIIAIHSLARTWNDNTKATLKDQLQKEADKHWYSVVYNGITNKKIGADAKMDTLAKRLNTLEKIYTLSENIDFELFGFRIYTDGLVEKHWPKDKESLFEETINNFISDKEMPNYFVTDKSLEPQEEDALLLTLNPDTQKIILYKEPIYEGRKKIKEFTIPQIAKLIDEQKGKLFKSLKQHDKKNK